MSGHQIEIESHFLVREVTARCSCGWTAMCATAGGARNAATAHHRSLAGPPDEVWRRTMAGES